MKLTKVIASALCAAACVTAWADVPFREHRYDSFQATPTEQGQIVFAGNSITNMHSWFEAFGSHQEVIGRGNSGGFAYELIEELESYIDAKPSKLFVMIGTNDISSGVSYQLTAKRIEIITRRVRLESPDTEIYLQSILPRSSNAKPDYELCNALVREFVENLNDEKVHFVNLSEVCAGVNGNAAWSHDGLHPRPKGYAAWTHAIEDMVGYPSVYPETVEKQESCGLSGSNAGRVEQFPYFTVSEGDVLFFGDEQVHGGEWHELFRSNKIKDRAQTWGWGGIALDKAKNVVASALSGQAVKPAKIFLFYGVADKDVTRYNAVVDEARKQAPDAKIYLVSLTPSTNSATNTANVNFNKELKTIATNKGATYVDVYTPMNANLSANIMHTNYVSGRGYIVMANELAKYLVEEQVKPVSLSEYETVYTSRANRKLIGKALNDALALEFGNKPGQIKEIHRDNINSAISAAVTAITSADLTADKAAAAAQTLNAAVATAAGDLNYPTASTEGNDHWYVMTSSRNNKALTASGSVLIGADAPGASTMGYNIWKFLNRGDDTYDIVNYYGQYVNPTATFNAQMSVTDVRPSAGFTLSYSNAVAGTFVIYSGDCQLNQTSMSGLPVFSWHGATVPDRADEGCSYSLAEYDGAIVDVNFAPVQSGWYEVKRASDNLYVTNMEAVQRQTEDNSYSMQYVATEQTSPKNWIYIDVDGNTRHVRVLNGFYLSEFTTNSLTADNQPMTPSQTVAGAYDVQYWVNFNLNGVSNVIGRSSKAVTPHMFKLVSQDALAAYDKWTVRIAAKTETNTELINYAKVTYNSENNKGIATVYDYGTFFVTPGTVISASDLTVTAPVGVAQEHETPVITIDAAQKTINVVLSGEIVEPDAPATETLESGWYTLTLKGYEGKRDDLSSWVTAALEAGTTSLHAIETEYEQTLNGSKHYYHVGVSKPESLKSPALTFFRVENPSLSVLNLRSQNGHHVLANGTASRAAANIALTLSKHGIAGLPLCLWKNNNIGCTECDLVGSFSGNTCSYQVAPADLSAYDLYTVDIVGETAAAAIRDDIKVTLSSAANRGLQAVYNGGTFFVEKGTAISVSDVDAPEHAGNATPFIEIGDGTITVDYTRVMDGIRELEAAAAGADEVYDLMGRRVATPRHGLYIVNGRKVRL